MLLPLLPLLAVTADTSAAVWAPSSVRDLHREYNNIFKFGNRNAASHLWSTFLFERAMHMTASTLEMMFSGFCAVSGSPTRPGDYTRYRLTLPVVGGGTASGFMYYCCWPCVCDTQDFIRVDTRNVTLASGESRQYHWAVVGNPCDDPSQLHAPFVQPFYGRGETTLAREAAEVRCDAEGRLIGATLSDHGYPIISMFFDAEVLTGGWTAVDSAGANAAGAHVSAGGAPQPGRVSRTPGGVAYQDEFEYGPMCAQRAAQGYNSGMGEIFRKVAAISPVRLLTTDAKAAELPAPSTAAEPLLATPTAAAGAASVRASAEPAAEREAATFQVDARTATMAATQGTAAGSSF